MEKLILRRLIAYGFDYLIIVVYALLLFGLTIMLNPKEQALNPIIGQSLGFITLTLPVFLYFLLFEKGKYKATIGKRIMHISVFPVSESLKPKILQRNILKFLPWEIAHTGVHWIVFYSKHDHNVPYWVWILLILPQLIMVVYLVSIIFSKGKSSIYDQLANCKIEVNRKRV